MTVIIQKGMVIYMARDIAIDMGTSNTKVYVKGKGLVVREPSFVSVNMKQDTVIAVALFPVFEEDWRCAHIEKRDD